MRLPGQQVGVSMHMQQQHRLGKPGACEDPKNYYVNEENHLEHQNPPAVFLTNTEAY